MLTDDIPATDMFPDHSLPPDPGPDPGQEPPTDPFPDWHSSLLPECA